MKQQPLLEQVKMWLEDKGFTVLITGDKTTTVIPISDLVPMAYKIPDLIGVNQKNRVAIFFIYSRGGKR